MANHPLFRLSIVALVGVLAYSNTFRVPFVFDDETNIVNNPAIRPGARLPFSAQRYLGLLTFAWNYAWGGLDVRGYHAVNLVIHLAAAGVVYLLVETILSTPCCEAAPGSSGWRVVSPWLCSLLFVCHPVQTQAVTYVVQRFASLATLFFLLSILAYGRARLARTWRCRVFFYAGSVVAALLSVKTKEIAFTLPGAILLFELLFFRGGWRRLLGVAPFAGVALLIPLALVQSGGGGPPATLDDAVHAGASPSIPRGAYLLTQFRVVLTYLRLLIVPVGQNLDYDYPIYRSLADPSVVLSLFFLAGVVGVGVLALARARSVSGAPAGRLRLAAFGVFWFLLTLSVESSVVPLADVIFEHRLYLPSFGAFLVAACALAALGERIRRRWTRAPAIATFVLVGSLAVATYLRNTTWCDVGGLWADVVVKSPGSARAHNNVANRFFMPAGRIDEAIAHYEEALRLRPGYADAHNNLGVAYERLGRKDNAVREHLVALRISPKLAAAHNNLGGIYLKQGRLADALSEIQGFLQLAPETQDAYFNLGLVYQHLARDDDAITAYLRALAINGRDADAHRKVADLYLKRGREREAIAHLKAVLLLRPHDQVARELLRRLPEVVQ